MARTLINVPPSPSRGEIIEVRALIQHPMETGYRPGADGKLLPRDIVRRFSCRFSDGATNELVISADLFPAVAANPYFAFYTVATGSGTLTFTWEGDNGFAQTETVPLKVA
jgi:sulfur-oxidizing protein SoxZ